MLAHEAWVRLIIKFLAIIVSHFEPHLQEWNLQQFGSHCYLCCLPDSDVDVQLAVQWLPPGVTDVDVTVGIAGAIRHRAITWHKLSGCSDKAIAHKQTFEFKIGGKAVDFRTDLNADTGARRLSEFLRAAFTVAPSYHLTGIRVFLVWVKGDYYYHRHCYYCCWHYAYNCYRNTGCFCYYKCDFP